jgi:thermitase
MNFAFTSTNLLPLLLITVGCIWFAAGMVRRYRGESFAMALPALAFLIGAVASRFFVDQESGLWSVLLSILRDLGMGMILGGIQLYARKTHPRVMIVPGILLMVLYVLLVTGTIGIKYGVQGFNQLFSRQSSASLQHSATGLVGDFATVLVELGPDDDIQELDNTLNSFQATSERLFPSVSLEEDADIAQYFAVRVSQANTQALLDALAKDSENVDATSLDQPIALFEPIASQQSQRPAKGTVRPNDPHLDAQWHLTQIDALSALATLRDSKPRRKATLAIIDTGVDGEHEDLKEAFADSPAADDKNGHGTHCAGIAGAVANNDKGVASLNWEGKWVTIKGFRGLERNGIGTDLAISRAIIAATEAGADVISLSLGRRSLFPVPILKQAVEYALNNNVVVVVAAGNDNQSADSYVPANIPGVITVTATQPDNHKTSFSNTAGKLTQVLAAPGQDIFSSLPNGQYKAQSGTSMAAPLVAGLAAILKAMNPDLSPSAIYQQLKQSATDAPDALSTGKIINAAKAIQRARS